MASGPKTRWPNLFIVGAPRCGTSSMNRYLGMHPDIFMSPAKEPHYFGSDLYDPTSIRDEAAYLSLFEAASDEKYLGEASVWYLYSERAAREIFAVAPDARIIVMLRNPVDMMLSLHLKHVFAGYQPVRGFEQALRLQAERKASQTSVPQRSFRCDVDYEEVARFGTQLERIKSSFGAERVCVTLFEEMSSDPAAAYKRILKFLDVDPNFEPPMKIHNAGRQVRSVWLRQGYDFLFDEIISRRLQVAHPAASALRKRLHRLNVGPPKQSVPAEIRPLIVTELKDEIDKLSGIIGRDLSHWS